MVMKMMGKNEEQKKIVDAAVAVVAPVVALGFFSYLHLMSLTVIACHKEVECTNQVLQ
jgi:hypothetical protein